MLHPLMPIAIHEFFFHIVSRFYFFESKYLDWQLSGRGMSQTWLEDRQESRNAVENLALF